MTGRRPRRGARHLFLSVALSFESELTEKTHCHLLNISRVLCSRRAIFKQIEQGSKRLQYHTMQLGAQETSIALAVRVIPYALKDMILRMTSKMTGITITGTRALQF